MKVVSISWIAVRELLYERVFYVLLAFAILGIVISIALGQMTYADHAKLSLDFMLGGAQISMALFSIFVGISLFQHEIHAGSVAMVLAKPISRTTFLLGKYLGQVSVQAAVILIMGSLTLASHSIQGPGLTQTWGITQSFFLTFLESCVLASLTYWVASFCGAMTTGTVAFSFFFLGHFRKTFETTSDGSLIWIVFEKLVPHLELFNLKTLATYGFALGPKELLTVTGYAVVCVAMFLCLAVVTFNERDILT